MFTSTSNQQSIAKLSIVGLLATLIVMMPLAQSPAKASTNIVPNNGVCNLTTVSPNVFSISNALELWEVTDCVATDGGDNTFRLNNDIPVPDESTFSSPIGASTSPVAFTGTLDGNNKSITGISISQGVGLFVALNNAEIKEVLVAGSISGSVNSAGLSASASGAITISNVISEVRVALSAAVAAGFLAYVHQNSVVSISDSENRGEVRSATGNGSGGFVGVTDQFVTISIEASTNSGPVTSNQAPAGGFIAKLGSDSVAYLTNVSNTADVEGIEGYSVGGLVGRSERRTQLLITSVENAGKIFVTADADDNALGGLVGYAEGTVEIVDSVNSGVVVGSGRRVGGLIGQADAGITINQASNTNTVSGSGQIGGLIGRAFQLAQVSDSTNSGIVTSLGQYAGGLVGRAQSVLITNSSNQALVSGDAFVGGLVGRFSSSTLESTISHSVNSGPVNGSSSSGGLVGQVNAKAAFFRSYNTGNVTGVEYQGGLVGNLGSGIALFTSEVFNTGNVSASSGDAGGFVGYSRGTVHLLNSFNAGSVTVDGTYPYAGGFLVQDQAGAASSATNSYQVGLVTKTGSGYTDAIFALRGGAPRVVESIYINTQIASGFPRSTDEQLQQRATFVGWDFDTVWGFVCGTNNNFPVLRFANSTATADDCGPLGGDTGSGGTPAPAPTYTGPTLVSQVQPVSAGNSVTFTGSKLDVVTKAMIGTTEVPISSQTATSLTITVPATLAAATYDLVLFSSFGTLSVMGAITITGAQAESVSQAQLIGWSWTLRFIGNSRSLSPAQDSHLRARVLAQPNATTVICWGYTTAASPNAWAIAHATQRAQAACDLVSETNPDLKTVVRLRYGFEKSWAMRSAVQFWG